MVHYVLGSMPHIGQERPAVIVRIDDGEHAVVTLGIFVLPGDLEEDQFPTAVIYTERSPYSLDKRPGTWHWIEE